MGKWFTGIGLVALTIATYEQVRRCDFINFDDPGYVTENSRVRSGLSPAGILYAFTTRDQANWHPLTWLSHMFDCEVFGLDPAGHHLTNLILHVVNSVLLLLVLRRLTGSLWPSSFVAALFALHPLNVESVAWVAERKNLLSTFFWILTMGAYVRYVERPRNARYTLVFLCLALGLMSKPMLVTLPFVLLLLDYWPLKRISPLIWSSSQDLREPKRTFSPYELIREKVPLIVLAAASSVMTFLVQQEGGTVVSVESMPVWLRLGNVVISYLRYMIKMFWPINLVVFYPGPDSVETWQVAGSALLLLGVSALVIRSAPVRPYLPVGWLWYLGTLLPVIGVVQVGEQAMADRYAYVPLIGLFMIAAWGASDLFSRWRFRGVVLAASAAAVLSTLVVFTRLQLKQWRNSETLFNYAIEVTPNNELAHLNYGAALVSAGKLEEGVRHYSEAVRNKPDFAEAHANLGAALALQGKLDLAVYHYSEALRFMPASADAHNNLGTALVTQGKVDEAMQHYSEALRIRPEYPEARHNMGKALASQLRLAEAVTHYLEALRHRPDFLDAKFQLALVRYRLHEPRDAVVLLREVLRQKPDWPDALNTLAWILATQPEEEAKNPAEATRLAERACGLTASQDPMLLDTLAASYAAAGRFTEAANAARQAIDLASSTGRGVLAEEIRSRLELYRQGIPYREPRPDR